MGFYEYRRALRRSLTKASSSDEFTRLTKERRALCGDKVGAKGDPTV